MKRAIKLTFATLITLLAISLAGCEESDLGRYCVVGFDNSSGGVGVKAINSEAPECLDRICVLQSKVQTTNDGTSLEVGQFCSKKCAADSECGGADKSANCDSGFICVKLGEESKDLNGKCICECKDYLTSTDICSNRCSASNRDKDSFCDTEK